MRGLYSVALYLLAPITVYHLIWRGLRQPAYFQRWQERYAFYARRAGRAQTLWVHAVSVGEVNAAVPLVNALRRSRPDLRLLVTTITPTGSERVRALWGDAVEHVYLPYDLPGAVGRFLEHYRPHAALIMETELWPNLLFGCRDRGIPALILNARLSERSLRGYRVLAPLVGARPAHGAHGRRAIARRRRALRPAGRARRSRCVEVGNLKFDVAVPEDLAEFAAQCRAHCRRAAGLDRGEHARGRGGGGHRHPSPPARAVPGPAAAVGAAPSRALPRRRRRTRARPAGRCRRARARSGRSRTTRCS